MDLQNLDL